MANAIIYLECHGSRGAALAKRNGRKQRARVWDGGKYVGTHGSRIRGDVTEWRDDKRRSRDKRETKESPETLRHAFAVNRTLHCFISWHFFFIANECKTLNRLICRLIWVQINVDGKFICLNAIDRPTRGVRFVQPFVSAWKANVRYANDGNVSDADVWHTTCRYRLRVKRKKTNWQRRARAILRKLQIHSIDVYCRYIHKAFCSRNAHYPILRRNE